MSGVAFDQQNKRPEMEDWFINNKDKGFFALIVNRQLACPYPASLNDPGLDRLEELPKLSLTEGDSK